MDALGLAGRILFSMMFVMSGMNHITKRGYMSEYAKSMGVPAAATLVPLSGLMIMAGGAMVAAGIWGDLGGLLIATFLVPTAMYMHAWWRVPEDQKQMQQAHFMKNMTMAGGALALMALFMCAEVSLTVTGPLFR